MYTFMTTGTAKFLKTVTETHPTLQFHYMKSGTSTLVLYESSKKKSIFVSGRSLENLYAHGKIHHRGFVAMDFIPVMEDTMPVFEERTVKVLPDLQQMKGLVALRFLKQLKSNQYVILTQWEKERNYIDWKNSPDFKQTNILDLARLPAYFAERPFTNTYFMLKEED